MTLTTTHILLLISIGLVIAIFILYQLKQVYRTSKSKSIRSKYPLTVAAIFYKGMYEHSSNEKLFTIFDKSKKEYIQEEKERAFVTSALNDYPLGISYLIGKHVFDIDTLDKDEVHTIYSNKDRLYLIQTSEADRAFYRRKFELLESEYPNGVEVYKNLYENENYIIPFEEYNEHEIKELDYKYEETQLFKVWEEEQKEFTQFCRSTIRKGLDCYYHDIKFTMPGYPGMNSDIHYRVSQHYKHLYSSDDELDYTHFSDILENRYTLEKYKDNKIDSKETFNKTLTLIIATQEKYGSVFVLFGGCDSSKDANIEFDYKKLQQVLDDKDIRYYQIKEKLPAYIPTEYVVIIELNTSNKHLISFSKSIIESFRPIPSFTYISLFKELDNDEMSKIIEAENKEIQLREKEE